jgi:hypothetical protein
MRDLEIRGAGELLGSRAIWVAIDAAGAWRDRLLHVLDILSAGMG